MKISSMKNVNRARRAYVGELRSHAFFLVSPLNRTIFVFLRVSSNFTVLRIITRARTA